MACAPDLAGLHRDTKLTHLTCHGILRGQIFCADLRSGSKDRSSDFSLENMGWIDHCLSGIQKANINMSIS